MPETHESPFARFLRLNPNYPNESTANVLLFEWVKEHGNAFTYDSFAAGWTALREEIIQVLSSANAERFLAECKDYPGGRLNAELMDAFITSQIGRDLVWSKENYWAAYEYLLSEGKFATEVEYTEQLASRQRLERPNLSFAGSGISSVVNSGSFARRYPGPEPVGNAIAMW
jgi:hypothetical protein